MVRYATIGTSWITDSFIAGAKQAAPELVLSGIYSRDEKNGREFGAKHGVEKIFTDMDELADSPDIDAVYIASPNIFHYPQSKRLLQGGKHVICEKTCVVTSEQLEELLGIAHEKNLIFMEAIKLLHMPEMDILERSMKQVGDIHLCHFDFSRYSSKYPAYKAGHTPNIFRPDLAAGCLMDMGVYSVYLAVRLFGEPESVSAHAVFMRTGADGAGGAILGYGDKSVVISYSKMSESHSDSTIQGDEGILSLRAIEHIDSIDLVSHKGERTPLHRRDVSRHVMGGEAASFYRWITDPVGNATEIENITETTRILIRTMERIREAAGIKFDI